MISIEEKVAKYMKARRRELEKKYNAVPYAKKKEFLDLMHAGEKLGEAGNKIGVDLDTAGEILMRNIQKVQFLRTEPMEEE
jgi:DNA-directed RNA polymerase specialized sigma24 family protein